MVSMLLFNMYLLICLLLFSRFKESKVSLKSWSRVCRCVLAPWSGGGESRRRGSGSWALRGRSLRAAGALRGAVLSLGEGKHPRSSISQRVCVTLTKS